MITERTGQRMTVDYMDLGRTRVRPGQLLTKGEAIGSFGRGPVCVEVTDQGYPVNPFAPGFFVPPAAGRPSP